MEGKEVKRRWLLGWQDVGAGCALGVRVCGAVAVGSDPVT